MEKKTSTVKPQWATHSHSLHTSPLSGRPSPTSSEEPGYPVSGLGEEGPYIILQSSSWSPGGSAHFASESLYWSGNCPVVAGTVQLRSCPESKAERKSPKHKSQAHILRPVPTSLMASLAFGGHFKGHILSLAPGRAEAP